MTKEEKKIINDEIHKRFLYVMVRFVGREKRFPNKKQFIEQLGWKKQVLNNLLIRDQQITIVIARELCLKLKINLNWLITGEGKMYL